MFFSCNHDDTILSVRGTVIDHTNDQPVANATVYLLGHEKDGGIWGGSPSFLLDSTISDGNGEFLFSPLEDETIGYSCMASKDLYFTSNEYTADGYMSLVANVYIYPKAWISTHCVNFYPYNEFDYFNISWSYVGPFYGIDIDTVLVSEIMGNYENSLTWYVTKNGESNTFTEQVYCVPFDTTFFEVLY